MQRLVHSVILVLLAGCFLFGSAAGVAQRKDTLGRINKIFVESFPSLTRESQVSSITRELTKRGFTVVDDRSQADAILVGEGQGEFVLHGDGSVPNKTIFTYSLSLPNHTVIWKHRVKFVSKPNLADDLDFAAVKIAERLYKDREKSLKMAARS